MMIMIVDKHDNSVLCDHSDAKPIVLLGISVVFDHIVADTIVFIVLLVLVDVFASKAICFYLLLMFLLIVLMQTTLFLLAIPVPVDGFNAETIVLNCYSCSC